MKHFHFILCLAITAAIVGCNNDPGQVPTPTPQPAPTPDVVTHDDTVAPAAQAAPPVTAPATTKTSTMAPALGTVQRDTELKAKPAIDAKTLKGLARGAPVTVIDRDGGWLMVTSDRQQGWVRLLHVSTQPPGARAGGTSELEAAAKIATGRGGSGNVVATTGIRGLDEAQLKNAEPNMEELGKLESYAATGEQAQVYAKNNRLTRRDVAHLPETK